MLPSPKQWATTNGKSKAGAFLTNARQPELDFLILTKNCLYTHFRLTCVSQEDGDDGACPSKHQTERQIMHWRSSFSFLRALAFIKRWFIFANSVLYLSKICSPRPSEMGRICVARNPWAFWRLESFAVSSLPLMTWLWTPQPSVLSWSSAVRACALPLSLSQQTSKEEVGGRRILVFKRNTVVRELAGKLRLLNSCLDSKEEETYVLLRLKESLHQLVSKVF